MGYEIDYIPVGEGEKSGDAIAFRYGNLHGQRSEQTVVVIDGGTMESGDALVDHIIQRYGTNVVDMAILTHPDGDHAHGMRRVLERITVRQLLMHLPWDHSDNVKALVDDDRTTVPSLSERAKKNLGAAWEIYRLAKERNIPILEPFAGVGTPNGIMSVLGPTREFYQQQLANFRFNPGTSDLVEAIFGTIRRAVSFLTEGWWAENLKDPPAGSTSPENNSSAIILFHIDGRKLLFTGDAGFSALTEACNYADSMGIDLSGITFFDVPHHGSRRNLGPTILNRLFGGIRQKDAPNWTAYVSASKDGMPKHPNKKVSNALRRRGANVYVTSGTSLCHFNDAPARNDYFSVHPVQFYNQAESDD